MKRNGWKSKHRTFLVACLFTGMSLLVTAESHSIENGKKAEIKGEKMIKTTLRISSGLWQFAKIAAIKEECTVQDIVTRALSCYVVKGGR